MKRVLVQLAHHWLRCSCAVSIALFCLSTTPASALLPSTPNVVFILADDLGFSDLAVYGGVSAVTPELDDLASEGLRFENFYANASVCDPSRAAFLTGLNPMQLGMRVNIRPLSTRGIPDEVLTMAEMLQGEGYATGHFGRWSIGFSEPRFFPTGQGFDTSARSPVIGETGYMNPVMLIDGITSVSHPGEHLTEVTTDYAIAFITANASGPFFANVWYNAPHNPIQPPAEYAARHENTPAGIYRAMVEHLDTEIGRLVDAIDSLGIADETLVIFTSDNGGVATVASNEPYGGGKGNLLEGGIRVPMIVRIPGSVTAGSTTNAVAQGVDVLPTLADMLGVDVSAEPLAGTSLLSVIADGAQIIRNDGFIWDQKIGTAFKGKPSGELHSYAVRKRRWKLLKGPDPFLELYDLKTDPLETVDLASTYPAKLAELEADYRAFRLESGLIDHAVEVIEGDVSQVNSSWTFGPSGGRVELAPNDHFNVHDSDFSFVASVTPNAHGGVIVSNPSAWTLRLTAGGRVQLVVKGEAGDQTILQSALILEVGLEYDVAFTIFSYGNSNNIVRLLVRGLQEDWTSEISAVAPSAPGPVYLGRNAGGNEPFYGTIEDIRFYHVPLRAQEMGADADRDGEVNFDDNCLFAPNSSQLDSDQDGFGNACDADYDNDGFAGNLDAAIFSSTFQLCQGAPGYLAVADSDDNGCIGISDYQFFYDAVFAGPGPSGLGCGLNQDREADAVCDSRDNCLVVDNPSQLDSDGDGYGNACDADYDNNGSVGASDWTKFVSTFTFCQGAPQYFVAADSDGDGCVSIIDFNLIRNTLGQSPGPSGFH